MYMEMDTPASAAQQTSLRASSGGGGGADDEMKAAAAALVAQLTASGDPKAILEAMAALPQVCMSPYVFLFMKTEKQMSDIQSIRSTLRLLRVVRCRRRQDSHSFPPPSPPHFSL